MVNWDQIKPYDFENLIGKLYEKLEFEVLVCKQTRDGGVDVLARKYYIEYGRSHLCVIQAKKYQRKVGIGTIQKLKGAMESKNADMGIVITTSEFTFPAKEEAMKLKNIELMSREKLERNLAEVGLIDIEEVDIKTDFADPVVKMKVILQTLKECPLGTAKIQELLKKLKMFYRLELDEKTLLELTRRLIRLNRIAWSKRSMSYIPSLKERAELESKIKTVLLSYTFPFDSSFLRMSLSKIFSLHPRVFDLVFNLTEILMEFVDLGKIIMLRHDTYVPSSLLRNIKSKFSRRLKDIEKYDIYDLTDSLLLGAIRDSKKCYHDAFKQKGVAESFSSRNFDSVSLYFEKELGSGKTLLVARDFEKIILVKDKKVLEVVEHLATMSDDGGIYMEGAKELWKINSELSDHVLKIVIRKICKKYKSHVSDHKLIVREFKL